MSEMYYDDQPLVELEVEGRVVKTFCHVWPGTVIFLISASHVARITGVSHHAHPRNILKTFQITLLESNTLFKIYRSIELISLIDSFFPSVLQFELRATSRAMTPIPFYVS
jgi:hypothetical protein